MASDEDDYFDFSFLFQEDDGGKQSLHEENKNVRSEEATIMENTNICMDVHQNSNHVESIVGGGNNKRKRSDEEEVSPRKCYKVLEKENPSHLLDHETVSSTVSASSNPRSSSFTDQPYIIDDNVSDVSRYAVENVGPTIGRLDPTLKAIFDSSTRKTPSPWTVDEHVRFLLGIEQGYKGDWKTVSRIYVRTRTVSQITSHAQKYFLHQQKKKNNVNGSANPSMRSRRSIHDIASLSDVEASTIADALQYVRSPIIEVENHH